MGDFTYREDFKSAPLINGGCYSRLGRDGRRIEGMVIGVRERSDGHREGWLYQYGYPPEQVIENTESFAGWELYARPHKLDTPIVGTVEEDELEATKRRLAEAQAKLERLQAVEEEQASKVTPEQVKEMKNSGMSWSEVGDYFGLPWQTCKKILRTGETHHFDDEE